MSGSHRESEAYTPELSWDLGTAYDFFVSLDVLHEPALYGLRGVWAAGMRSRLPAAHREFLEEVMGAVIGGVPLVWVYGLPQPKDGAAALHALARIPPAERLLSLVPEEDRTGRLWELLLDVATRGTWDESDLNAVREAVHQKEQKGRRHRVSRRELATMLGWLTRLDEFGERYLKALQAYYEVFFAEEERRIYPALQEAIERSRELAARLSVPELIEELSQGVSFAGVSEVAALTLIPSYWSAPLVYFHLISPDRALFMFGARPADASLVPGETVPEALLRALEALSDPTRLRIMRYLAVEALTPTQLSHRLRLRAPTVVHHLQMLRSAGLVQVTVAEGKERSYSLRAGSVIATCEALRNFLSPEADEREQ